MVSSSYFDQSSIRSRPNQRDLLAVPTTKRLANRVGSIGQRVLRVLQHAFALLLRVVGAAGHAVRRLLRRALLAVGLHGAGRAVVRVLGRVLDLVGGALLAVGSQGVGGLVSESLAAERERSVLADVKRNGGQLTLSQSCLLSGCGWSKCGWSRFDVFVYVKLMCESW